MLDIETRRGMVRVGGGGGEAISINECRLSIGKVRNTKYHIHSSFTFSATQHTHVFMKLASTSPS